MQITITLLQIGAACIAFIVAADLLTRLIKAIFSLFFGPDCVRSSYVQGVRRLDEKEQIKLAHNLGLISKQKH